LSDKSNIMTATVQRQQHLIKAMQGAVKYTSPFEDMPGGGHKCAE